MIVITNDDEEPIPEQEILIEVIPAWKWLCRQVDNDIFYITANSISLVKSFQINPVE